MHATRVTTLWLKQPICFIVLLGYTSLHYDFTLLHFTLLGWLDSTPLYHDFSYSSRYLTLLHSTLVLPAATWLYLRICHTTRALPYFVTLPTLLWLYLGLTVSSWLHATLPYIPVYLTQSTPLHHDSTLLKLTLLTSSIWLDSTPLHQVSSYLNPLDSTLLYRGSTWFHLTLPCLYLALYFTLHLHPSFVLLSQIEQSEARPTLTHSL